MLSVVKFTSALLLSLLTSTKLCNWAPGARFSKVPRTFRARKAICKTTTCLFCKAGLSICCKGNKNKNNCKVSCLETPSFWRYKENYVIRNTPEKFSGLSRNGPLVSFDRTVEGAVPLMNHYSDRPVFKWLSEAITQLQLPRLAIGSRQFLNQWQRKPKPVAH